MSRISRPASLLVALFLATAAAPAQEALPAERAAGTEPRRRIRVTGDAPPADELRDLRAVVEKQSKQIDALTEQIARLNHTLDAKSPGAEAPVPQAVPPAPAVLPASTPAPAPAPNEFPPDAPKAELASPGARHVVVKGETLTSIAKHYNITVAELQKANKDVNERKLQIGQTLNIPTPKTPDATPEKKENP